MGTARPFLEWREARPSVPTARCPWGTAEPPPSAGPLCPGTLVLLLKDQPSSARKHPVAPMLMNRGKGQRGEVGEEVRRKLLREAPYSKM